MSNIYIKEPSTNGKVLLHTSLGDIDIELWSKEAPIACRNFVQLCMEGYYDNVIFHRVVPGFIVQGGDPTGTGSGGESIFGKPFKDELHQRLRFVRRGLVAMANAGPNDNASQFFFTLGPCNDLNKKHTIFAKVTGDTVYNMVRLGEVDVDENERPLNPPMIKWTKVLANPFDDIEPRVEPERNRKKKDDKTKAKSQSRATKDYKLLSFGDEAEFDEEESIELSFKGSKSSHDLAKDPKLSAAPAISKLEENDNEETCKRDRDKSESSSSDSTDESSSGKEEKKNSRQRIKDKLTAAKRAKIDRSDTTEKTISKENIKDEKLKQLRNESRMLARELAGKSKENIEKDDSSSGSDNETNTASSNQMFAEYKAQQKIYRDKIVGTNKKGFSREQQTLAMLGSFRSKMLAVKEEESSEDEAKDDDDNNFNVVGWMNHKFKNVDHELRDAKDMNRDVNEDRYEITDPRNPLNQRRRENDKKKKDSSKERHRDSRRNESSRRDHHHSDRHHRHRR
uniref:spliceosome-associated protein CWC27 homolog n=1 Tax=Styela clava TaxID=7725 RepID=UPI001939371C|nr:spliceosome-associated protein CWC27 homolog [Styela clava]